MWLITTRGFYSAVQDTQDPTMIYVRGRAKRDLDALGDLLPNAKPFQITERSTDYPWRLHVLREDWATACALLANEIDYSNFKSAVGARDKKRATIYSRIWGILLGAEEGDDRSMYAEPRVAPPSKRGKKARKRGGRSRGTQLDLDVSDELELPWYAQGMTDPTSDELDAAFRREVLA